MRFFLGESALAAEERRALSDLLEQVGPGAPTLCAGWTTRDLAAHLVLREGRPDASLGILLSPLAGYTDRVQRAVATMAWPELIKRFRQGPPWWSPLGIGDINSIEFFVHHEDVRRARSGWAPRPPEPHRSARLWTLLSRAARLCYRKVPVGVVLRRPDGVTFQARNRPSVVVVIGAPEELALHAYGRAEARVEFEGAEDDISALRASPRGY